VSTNGEARLARPCRSAAIAVTITAAILCAAAAAPLRAQQIRGDVVVQGTDMPVARATVTLLDMSLAPVATTRTDVNGAFVFTRLSPGSYMLQAAIEGVQTAVSPPVAVAAAGTELTRLELPSPLVVLALTCGPPLDPDVPSTVLVGTAHDRDSGVALPHAALELTWSGSVAAAVTDGAGNFRFCDVPPDVPMTLSTNVWGRQAATDLTLTPAPINRADLAVSVGTVQLTLTVTGRRPLDGGGAALVVTLMDAATGAPLTGAGAALRGAAVLTSASSRGVVRFAGLTPGEQELRIEQVGYGLRVVELTLEDGEELFVEVRVPAQPIALDPIGVRAEPESERRTPREASTRVDVIAGAQMAFAEQRGAQVADVIRQQFPGLLVSDGAYSTLDNDRAERILCVESVRRLARLQPPDGVEGTFCEMVAVIVDGVPAFHGGALLRNMSARELESVEFLGPLDAGGRYGARAGQTGALLLWTRGRGPYQSPARNAPPGR
jgi:hypothetical protein